MSTQVLNLKKRKSHAFGKDIYLLGQDSDGTNYWLEAPKWDCGWYWGFGYVETYTNNANPSKSRDISSHQHIDSSFMGNQGGTYIYNIYDAPLLSVKTFTEKEGWSLSELFKTFYNLKTAAEVFGEGNSGIYNNTAKETVKNEEWAKHINDVMIPAVTDQILKILSPC